MNKSDLERLARLAQQNGINPHTVIVAFHIAMDYVDNEGVITHYGTIACDSIRELRDEINPERASRP